MRPSIMSTAAIAALVLAGSASAMTLQSASRAGGARAAAVDPDARLERLAAASQPGGVGHGRASKAGRTVLKDDPYLRQAFAWMGDR